MPGPADLDALAGAGLDDIELALTDLVSHRRENRLDFFTPYPKQLEFFAMGATKTERLLMAGNRLGKTMAGAFETAVHLTGLYPAWWPGRRWRRPVSAWAAGMSTTVVRDVTQTLLCGPPEIEDEFGTGFIPAKCFVGRPSPARGGVSGAYDTIRVQHCTDGVPDGVSRLGLKSYEQGRTKFQGSDLDFWWPDEEPDMDIYSEGCARYTSTGGMAFMTFTPLFGMSTVVGRFVNESNERRGYVQMGYKDAAHMTPELVADALSKYPAHEHDARMNGDPLLGSGRIFTEDPASYTFPRDMTIQPWFRKIWGIDFGGAGGGAAHPFAAVLLAIDPDTDEKFVCATYKQLGGLPMVHADALRRICSDAPVAWPHDGNEVTRGAGDNLMPLYKQFDLKMLSSHAHYPGGGYSTEAAVLDMQQGFQRAGGPGGLRVREDLADFFWECRQYHRIIDRSARSVIVKKHDDLISACQKAIMMRRYAQPVALGWHPRSLTRAGSRPTEAPPTNPWTGAEIHG